MVVLSFLVLPNFVSVERTGTTASMSSRFALDKAIGVLECCGPVKPEKEGG